MVIWTGAALNGRGVTGVGRSGGGVAVGRASSMIVWKMTPSFSMASIAASPMSERGVDGIGFFRG